MLFLLPYEASRSPCALLDHLCIHLQIEQRHQAILLKTGLYLINIKGRMAFFTLLGSLLFTFESVARMRKPLKDVRQLNLFYKDIPSYATGPDTNIKAESIAGLTFRDEEWHSMKA